MSDSEVDSPSSPRATQEAEGRRSRPTVLRLLLVVVLFCVGLAVWLVVTTPRLDAGSFSGVSSSDHAVMMADGLLGTVYVVPADGDGATTLTFGIHNAGPLAVELLEVWPGLSPPACLWEPHERLLQDEPQLLGVLDERARPVSGTVLAPGAQATLWITGAHPDPDGCTHGAFTLHDDVEVRVRIAGRTTTTRVPLPYVFGYADEPERLEDTVDYRVLPPAPSSTG